MFKQNPKFDLVQDLKDDAGLPYRVTHCCQYLDMISNHAPTDIRDASMYLIKNKYIVGSEDDIECSFRYSAVAIWVRRHHDMIELLVNKRSPRKLNFRKLRICKTVTNLIHSARKHK